ncbi:MAG: amidohydrolase [Actinomycetes bacterium]
MTTTLLRGGRILSPDQPGATAMLVRDGRVAWVGDRDGAAGHADGADEILELGGALVTAAFVDAHVHLSQTGLALRSLDLAGIRSLGEALDALAAFARRRGDAVLLGFGWDETRWPEHRPPTVAEIDRAVGDRICYLSRVDGHSAIASGAMLSAVPQIATADGWDGTGRVERAAHHVARDAVQSRLGAGQRREALRTALDHAASLGLGCIHEIGAPHINPSTDFADLSALAADAPTITVVPYWGELHAVAKVLDLGCRGAAGDLNADGSIGSRTAALSARYADADSCGHAYLTADEVREHVAACTRSGLQAGFHAIGDAGVTAVVDGMRAAADEVGLDAFVAARHRIEHLEMVTAEQAAELARLGVVASVQPAFDAAWGGADRMYAERLGIERALAMNPYRLLSDAGVTLAFGSDSPVTALDPWGGVRAAVRHHVAEQRLDPRTALTAHTRGGWQAAGRDDAGTLEPGRPATFAVWEAAGLAEAIEHTPACRQTVVDGWTVFAAG